LTNRSRKNLVEGLTVSATDAADRLAAEEGALVARIAEGDLGAPVAELYRR
jgi:hypothetical protein